ncbi:aminotransferase class V-fold PLP-dependent enzyme, partial [archaeon]
MQKLDYSSKDGFIDVPLIIKEGKKHELFPGLLSYIGTIRTMDFPLFEKLGRVYLDNAATSQEPQSVINRMHEYRKTHIRGSSHSENSAEAREAHEKFAETRKKVANFFNSGNYYAVFTSGTTGASNSIASRFPFEKGDMLLLTEMEHNSQILTARNCARKAGSEIAYVEASMPEGRLNLEHLESILYKRKKGRVLFNLVHVSNLTGVVNPVKEIRKIMDETVGDRGFIYLDMAQSAG